MEERGWGSRCGRWQHRQSRVLVLQRSTVCKRICNLWAALHNPFPSPYLLPLFPYPSLVAVFGFFGSTKKVACKRKCLQNEVATWASKQMNEFIASWGSRGFPPPVLFLGLYATKPRHVVPFATQRTHTHTYTRRCQKLKHRSAKVVQI